MAPQAGGSLVSRQRVRSISFDPADADRVDTLVELLREAGYAKAARAEVARAALQELHHVLAGRTRARSPHQSGSPAVGVSREHEATRRSRRLRAPSRRDRPGFQPLTGILRLYARSTCQGVEMDCSRGGCRRHSWPLLVLAPRSQESRTTKRGRPCSQASRIDCTGRADDGASPHRCRFARIQHEREGDEKPASASCVASPPSVRHRLVPVRFRSWPVRNPGGRSRPTAESVGIRPGGVS